jgi:hypothetical protein
VDCDLRSNQSLEAEYAQDWQHGHGPPCAVEDPIYIQLFSGKWSSQLSTSLRLMCDLRQLYPNHLTGVTLPLFPDSKLSGFFITTKLALIFISWFLDNPEGVNWTPPADLVKWMAKARNDRKPIVYIGFGSITVPHPNRVTARIVKAVLRGEPSHMMTTFWQLTSNSRCASNHLQRLVCADEQRPGQGPRG